MAPRKRKPKPRRAGDGETPGEVRPKLAVWKFASCDGCQLTLLDCEDALLEIAAKVEKILNTPNLFCPEAPLLFMALDLYVHANIDFVDAYNAFHMKAQGLTEILTYDRKHFARIPWVQFGDL